LVKPDAAIQNIAGRPAQDAARPAPEAKVEPKSEPKSVTRPEVKPTNVKASEGAEVPHEPAAESRLATKKKKHEVRPAKGKLEPKAGEGSSQGEAAQEVPADPSSKKKKADKAEDTKENGEIEVEWGQ
jgi:hypothetical protein